MVEARILAAVREVMKNNGMRCPAEINPSDSFIDLGLDSLTMAELTCHFERIAGCRLNIDDLMDVETIQEAINLIGSKVCTKDSRTEPAK